MNVENTNKIQNGKHDRLSRANGTALVLAPFNVEALNALSRLMPVIHESWTDTRNLYSPEKLVERLNSQHIQVLVVEADFIFDEVFEQAKHLRFLGVCRGNPNQIDLEAATNNGIIVVKTPGRNARAVAELTLGLLLSLARSIPSSHNYVTSGYWDDPMEPYISLRGTELYGKTLGLIGLGTIGRIVSMLGKSLGMRVIAHDPYLEATDTNNKLARILVPSLQTLLNEADFLSIHVPLNEDTQRMLTTKHLSLMKQGSYIVNTAAYGVIDERALVDSLQSGHIAGVALDVHETHPLLPTSPFLKMDNVIFTPHIGGATRETIERHSKMVLEDLNRFLKGTKPKHLANPKVWGKHRG